MLQSDNNEVELYRNITTAENRVVDSYQLHAEFEIYDNIVERSFLISPSINYTDGLHGDAICIWLDDTIGTSVECQWFNIVKQLRQINDHVEVFTNVNKCIQYINATGIEQIFLIVTGTYGDDFDEKLFQDTINDVFIYVFTSNTLEYNGDHMIIRGYFNNANTLINRIRDDYMVYVTNTVSAYKLPQINTNGSTTRCIDPQVIKWKCSQLMFDILRRMPCLRQESLDSLVQLCTSYYRGNSRELDNINQFQQNYRPCDAVRWYSKECFLYRLLNKSFRTDNVDTIMLFSFFTMDICDQLHELRCQYDVPTTMDNVVYRGTLLTIDEFQYLKLNIGRFISTNGFLSTSKNREVAFLFINSEVRKDCVSVMFEISCNHNLSNVKPFADVSAIVDWSAEEEVLFANGSIFRIDSIEPISNNFWSIKLTVCDDLHSIVDNLSDYFDAAILQLLEIVPKISPKTNKANDRMIQWWRLYSKDDPKELVKIDQFEESYRSDSSIRWYTKDSLLYRLLNTALRQENIDIIIDFRYFIIDLYEQLTKSHLDYVRSFKQQNLTVYRGQKMSLLELRRLKHNIGKYISITSFFSASLSSEVALQHAELDESDRKQYFQSVLFQIDINMKRLNGLDKDHIFANIMNLSNFVDEEEVLFMMNTKFRIESVTKWNGIFWLVCLTLLSQNDEDSYEIQIMNQYLNYLTNMVIQRCGDSFWSFFKNDCVKSKRYPHF